MFRMFASALIGASLLCGAVAAQPPKSKDPPKKEAPKDKPPPKEKEKTTVKEVVGMFKSKDVAKKTLTLTVDGKERTFKITEDTKIVGPRGGEKDLNDKLFDAGYKITVVPNSKNSDEAVEVRLPFVNDKEGADKAKDKSKDKPKDKPKQ